MYYNAWFNGKGSTHVTQGHGFKYFWSHTMPYHDSRRLLRGGVTARKVMQAAFGGQ